MDQLENTDEKIILDENIPVTNADQRQFIRKFEIWRSLYTKQQGVSPLKSLLFLVLTYENYINLIEEAVFSGLNNYFKWLDYNPGWYWQFGCLGWRSKRFLYGVLQFEFNFNLGRGAFWTIIGIIVDIIFNVQAKTTVAMYVATKAKSDGLIPEAAYFFVTLFQGLISTPLTVHIAKFDFHISFSIDSLLWKFARKRCMNKIERKNELVDESDAIYQEMKLVVDNFNKNNKNDNNRLEESDGN